MATDLSSIIKETIYSTLEITLSTPIEELGIYTCNQDCLNGKNIVSISSSFAFESLTTSIEFIFPAYFASYTFNTMMMEEAEPSEEIDDEIADALKEVAAQISGSLETAINSVDDDTLGTCKYSAGEVKIDKGDNYADVVNLILINFKTNEKEFELFLNFDDEISAYIEEFLNKDLKILEIAPLKNDDQESEQIEVANEDDKSNEQAEEDKKEEPKEEESEQIEIDEDKNNENKNDESNTNEELKNEDDNLAINEEDEQEQKKNKKLKIAIIAVASILVLILITFGTLYFTGFFDPVPIVHKKPKPKPSPQDLVLANIKNKQITYSSDMIDVKKLNKRLALLTKYEILEEDILQEYKRLEKERLYKLKMQSLEEFALKNKEESIFKNDLIKNKQIKNRFDNNETNTSSIQYKKDNEIITLIQIDALIYNKYTKAINKEKTKSTAISMCKNKEDKTYVYIGPLYINTLINNIIKKVGKKDAKLIRIKRKEFDKMCDF